MIEKHNLCHGSCFVEAALVQSFCGDFPPDSLVSAGFGSVFDAELLCQVVEGKREHRSRSRRGFAPISRSDLSLRLNRPRSLARSASSDALSPSELLAVLHTLQWAAEITFSFIYWILSGYSIIRAWIQLKVGKETV